MDTVKPEEMIVIESGRGGLSSNLRELWEYRELIFFLTWRDIKVRYAQTLLGIVWAVLQPVTSMVVFSVIFGNLAHLSSDGIPYPIFTYAALLPWQLFSGALSRSGTSLVANSRLLTKVYFPRLVIPLSAVMSCVIDFAISALILFFLLVYYGILPGKGILWFPLVGWTLIASLSMGLWLSALNVQYRDVEHMIPFVMQIWMFISPIAYSATLIPIGPWRFLYGLNPLVGIIQGFRCVLLGAPPPGVYAYASGVMVIVLLISGFAYFRRMERFFADVV